MSDIHENALAERAARALQEGDTATYAAISDILGYRPGGSGEPVGVGTRLALEAATPEQRQAIAPGLVHAPGGDMMVPDARGQLAPVNPPGLDWGDVPSVLGPLVANAGGAVLGGLGGAAAGAPAGPGAALGAAAGGALGATAGDELWRGLALAMSPRPVPEIPVPEHLKRVGTDLALNAAGEGLAFGARAFGPHLLADATSAERIAAAERAGVTPTAGMIGARPVQTLENALEGSSFGSPAVERARATAADTLGDAVDRLTQGAYDSPAEAGQAVQDALSRAGDAFMRRAEQLYGAVQIPGSRPMPVAHTRAFLDAATGLFENEALGKVIGSPLMARLRDALDAETLTYTELAKLRSAIGKAVGARDSHLLGDSSLGELKGLYGAILRDIEAGAGDQLPALLTATAFYRQGREKFDALDWIHRAETPEAVYRRIVTAMQQGGTTPGRVAHILTPEETVSLGKTRLAQMGRAAPGAQDATGERFSPAAFLTNWNRTSPDARGVLFEDLGRSASAPPGAPDDVLDLLTLSDAAKRASLGVNTSGTGRVFSMGGVPGVGYLALGPAGAVVAPVATAGLANFIESGAGRKLIARAADALGRPLTQEEIAALAAGGALAAQGGAGVLED
jgi:hypothetical protein